MITSFALLFGGMAVVLGLCVLGLGAAPLVQDTGWEKRTKKKAPYPRAPTLQFPKAA